MPQYHHQSFAGSASTIILPEAYTLTQDDAIWSTCKVVSSSNNPIVAIVVNPRVITSLAEENSLQSPAVTA